MTGVHYITPPHPITGLRRRCDINPKIQAFLDISGNTDLALDNFNLARKELGLGKDFEVCRKAMCPGPSASIYSQFFKEVEGSRNGLLEVRKVACILCEDTVVSYHDVSKHMKMFHLPDETCPTCSSEISAENFSAHKKWCASKRFKGDA